MTNAIQIKLLAAILALLVVIAGLLGRATHPKPAERIQPDLVQQKKFENMAMPPAKPYLVP